MSIFKAINRALPEQKALTTYPVPALTRLHNVGQGVTLYPADTGQTYIQNGFKLNPIVYAICNASAKKFAQVPFYHYRIKKDERKTWEEYQSLTRTKLDHRAVVEAKNMRTKALSSAIVDSPLSKFLARPNRNMTGSENRHSLFMYYLLTGEGNTWLSRGFDEQGNQLTTGKPLEGQVIPKANLLLVKGNSAWDIEKYIIVIGGEQYSTPKENMITWINPNPQAMIDGVTMEHLRGFAPLESARYMLQAFNEGAERLVNINKNQGAAGLAYNKEMDVNQLDPATSSFMRGQFDDIINNGTMSGKIAMLNGDWGFHQFGMDVGQLKMLEQMDKQTEIFCNVLGFPPGLLTKNQTWDNQRAAGRRWIYDTIAPACFGLRDEYNDKLTPAFNLDRERDVVDAAITDLEELSEDVKTQAEAIKNIWGLTPNQMLEYLGFDRSNNPNMDKVYVPSGYSPLDDVAAPMNYED